MDDVTNFTIEVTNELYRVIRDEIEPMIDDDDDDDNE